MPLMPASQQVSEVLVLRPAGNATLQRGFDSLEQHWQSHAGPSNFVPALQPRSPSSAAPSNIHATKSNQDSSGMASGTPDPSCSNPQDDPASKDIDAQPHRVSPSNVHKSGEDLQSAAAGTGISTNDATPQQLPVANATLDKNLLSLQRRWDSQKRRWACVQMSMP